MINNRYANDLLDILRQAYQENEEKINLCVEKVVDNIMNDRIIHMFGTGHSHMVGIEVFARAGGLANVNAILDPDQLTVTSSRVLVAVMFWGGLHHSLVR